MGALLDYTETHVENKCTEGSDLSVQRGHLGGWGVNLLYIKLGGGIKSVTLSITNV